jgi:tetratricopeptide (TPR) repeat protein
MIIAIVAGMVMNGCAPKTIRPRASSVTSDAVTSTAVEDREGATEKEPWVGEEELADFEFTGEAAEPGSPDEAGGSGVNTERIRELPSVSFVDRRMMFYADKLSNWEALALELDELDQGDRMPTRWNGCLASIEEMFRGYSVLMEALLAQDQPAVNEEKMAVDPWSVYQKEIDFLEEGCDQVFEVGASLVGNRANRLPDTESKDDEAVVVRYVDEGRYEDAIEMFAKLMEAQPGRTVDAHTGKMYGIALLRTGRFEIATEVLAGALENMRPSYEKRELRRLVADLQLASGNLALARAHYRKLADFESTKGGDRWVADQLALLGEVDAHTREFPLYLEVLKGYLSFDGRHIHKDMPRLVERMAEDFRESPWTDQARQMLVRLEDSVREWAAGRLDEVDLLMANNNYAEAKAVLEKLLYDDLPAPVHGMVQRAMDNLLQVEMKSRARQEAVAEQTLSEQWDQAVWLLDSKKYDEAIDTFKNLLNTEYDVPARVNIRKAAEAASVEMRHRSATIFVKARKETDESRKREFFRESWQLLNEIIVKYPEVGLIDKVRQNLEIIEKHIEVFDPRMLDELKPDRKFGLEGHARTTWAE